MNESKKLKRMDVFLSIVCSLLFVDTIATSASTGIPVITWFIIISVFFMIPNGMLIAEMGGAYPDAGGIYGWILRAFGNKAAARLSFLYWINYVIWMPSAFIWIANFFMTLFFPEAGYWVQVVIGIVLTWLTVFIGSMSVSESKWIINIAAIIKVIIYFALGISALIYIINGNEPANTINLETLKPTLNQALMYLPVIVVCCCGFEVVSAEAINMKNPKRDVPFAIIGCAVLLVLMYLMSSFSMLTLTPVGEMDVVYGVLYAIKKVFSNPLLIGGLGILIVFSVFAQMCSWGVATSIAIAESGASGEMPAVLGKKGKNDSPKGALIITGMLSTLLIVVYGLLVSSAEELFWSMFAFSAVIYFLPYVLMYLAYIKLKKTDLDTKRPFKCPLGNVCSIVCMIIILINILLLIWVPGTPFDAAYVVSILIGVAVCFAAEEIIIAVQSKRQMLKRT